MAFVGEIKILGDGTILTAVATSGHSKTVAYIFDDEEGSKSDVCDYEHWDGLENYNVAWKPGRTGKQLYEWAKRNGGQTTESWMGWEYLTIAEMKPWNKLAEALDEGEL